MQLKSSTPKGKIDCYINFAVRAGKILWGIDSLERAKRTPCVVLYDEEIGANSFKQLDKYCQKKKANVVKLPKDYLNQALNRSNVKVLSITDESLARAILSFCE